MKKHLPDSNPTILAIQDMRRGWIQRPLIGAFLVALIILLVVIVAVLTRAPGYAVQGQITSQDAAEVVQFAKREIRRNILPDFSWASLKRAPAALKGYLSIKLIEVQAPSLPETSIVEVRVWLNTNGLEKFPGHMNYPAGGYLGGGDPESERWRDFWPYAADNSQSFLLLRKANSWAYFDAPPPNL